MFHDFLGMKAQSAVSPVVLGSKTTDASPSASISAGAASSGGGARGPHSTTSDIASERRAGNHLEGIPFYGPEISNRLAGIKRSNSDSARDGIPRIGHDSLESLHLMMMLSKWDRAGQFAPFAHKVHMNKFKDTNTASPLVTSQSAADEGSRTGIKGRPGILSSINAASGNSEKIASGATPSGSKPESSTPLNRQMTVFYGGHAHVFDDVHPNKADVIMALAGSNGGSWSTTYSSKPRGVNEATVAQNTKQGRGSGVHHGAS